MSAELTVYNALRAASPVTALVPQARITPVKRLQNTDLPAITYERVTNDPVQSLSGDTSNLDQVRMRVNCWSLSYSQSKSIAAVVRTALKPLDSYFISDQDLYEDDTQIYRVALDYYIWGQP
jgi:hypothetical protein